MNEFGYDTSKCPKCGKPLKLVSQTAREKTYAHKFKSDARKCSFVDMTVYAARTISWKPRHRKK